MSKRTEHEKLDNTGTSHVVCDLDNCKFASACFCNGRFDMANSRQQLNIPIITIEVFSISSIIDIKCETFKNGVFKSDFNTALKKDRDAGRI